MMSGELMEPMDELPLKELGDERIGEIGAGVKQLEFILESKGSIGLLEERSVIRRDDDVDGRASVTKDEERVLRGG